MAFVFPIETARQYLFIVWSVLFTALAMVAVGLRLLARRVADRKLGSDDFLMVLSCIVLMAYQVVSILAVAFGGMGYHVDEIEHRFGISPPTEAFTKYFLTTQIMWCFNLTFTKAAILTLYIKIFTMRPFVIIAKITVLVTGFCSTIMIVGSSSVCRPIAFYWDKDIVGGVCGDYPALWTANACISIATSVVTLVLPIPHVWRLQLERSNKIFLIGAFSLGFLTCIAGAVYISMIASYDSSDSTYNALPMMFVAFVEPAMGIALGCVPVMRPLFKRARSHTGALKLTGPESSTVSGASCSHANSSDSIAGQELHSITVKTSWYVHHHGWDSKSALAARV
ncbi:hypothetical protein PG995_003335 [Apiospora arundinis]